MRVTVGLDSASKTYTCIHDSTKKTLLTAQRRTDGLKALASSANYSILLSPADHSTCREPVKICKLRSNAACSQYSLYDTGKNPAKAAGVMEMRRELMGVRLEVIGGIYTRRATYCVLPLPDQVKRPAKREETLVERWKKCDSGLVGFSPFLVTSNHDRLPSLDHFGGFAATHSIKNTMLHDVVTKQIVFKLGRQTSNSFSMEFAHPFSIVSAFALAVAICDSKVHPKHQL